MIGTIFSAIFSAVLKMFGMSPEQKLGRLEVESDVQEKTIHDLEIDKAVSDRVDAMSDAERVRLADAINSGHSER